MKESVKFNSTVEIIKIMEGFFDEISFPQRQYVDREFFPKPEPVVAKKAEREVRQYMSEEIFDSERGKKATFVVQVQFRRNSTWQGTITWTDQKKTKNFRSALELIKLMDGAIESNGAKSPPEGDGWEQA